MRGTVERFSLGTLLWVLVAWTLPSGAEELGNGRQLVEVAPGIYAALQSPAQRFNDSNSVLILRQHDVVVVDSQASAQGVRDLITALRKLTDKPVRYLINTHWHGDHTDGNVLWQEAYEGLEVVGHRTLREDIPGRAEPYRREQIRQAAERIHQAELRLEQGVDRAGEPLGEEGRSALGAAIEAAKQRLEDLRAIQTLAPTLTYDGELVLRNGGREIHLLHAVAHSRGDTVIFLPKEKILIAGDLLDEMPYGGHGYPSSWVATLEHLETLDFTHIIPGHGGVLEGKEHLKALRDFLQAVRGQVAPIAIDKSLDEVQEAIDLSLFRERLAGGDPVAQRNFDGFLPSLVERVYLEARGELDSP